MGARRGQWAAWLVGLTVGMLLALGVPFRLLAGRYADDPTLNRAARALVGRRARPGTVRVSTPRAVMDLPARVRLDPGTAVRLAVEIARLQREMQPEAAARLSDGLATYLKTDDTAALVVLRSLGRPGERSIEEPLREAVRSARAWPTARRELMEERGVSGQKAFAVRCDMVRQSLTRAFETPGGRERAVDALARYATLAPPQADAVLTMAATLYLADHPRAGPVLERLARDHPELAEPVIEFRSEAG